MSKRRHRHPTTPGPLRIIPVQEDLHTFIRLQCHPRNSMHKNSGLVYSYTEHRKTVYIVHKDVLART